MSFKFFPLDGETVRATGLLIALGALLVGCGGPEEKAMATLEELGFESGSAEDFHRAAREGAANAVSLFLESGMDIEALSMTGFTPLMTAAKHGQLGIVKQLVQQGANLEASDPEGRTSLLLAAAEGKTAVARLLIARKASLNVRDREGWNALSLAAFNG